MTTIDDRRAQGRAARHQVPRRALGAWDPKTRTQNPLDTIVDQSRLRIPDLVPLRHGRMAASPWTYFRGAAAVMANDLADAPHTGLSVQICGDAHVLNFGLWATPERNLSFDLRDFDETLTGPFEWDVKRLATSLVVLARDNDQPPSVGVAATAATLRAYRRGLARYATAHELDVWYDRIDVDQLLGFFEREDRERVSARIEKQARTRTSHGAARKLTAVVEGRRRITEDPPRRRHLDDADELELERAVFESYGSTLSEDRRHLLERFSVTDVVRQVVGVGSVGMRVYLVMLEGRSGDDPLFLQIKQAGPSVYEQHLGPSHHRNHGQRVVEGKRLIQSATDIFVGWTSVQGMDFYVRQFRDMKVIPDGARIAPRLAEFAEACGLVLARAHARTGDAVAISSYLGKNSSRFDESISRFAHAYADQNERDHRGLVTATETGLISSAPG